ncbi:MAG: hypothetical protein IJ733_12570 [Lachnospiraceae bacterium]|nr:hypothetical protein [Lachnospiraceae bacterium]
MKKLHEQIKDEEKHKKDLDKMKMKEYEKTFLYENDEIPYYDKYIFM